MLSEMDRLEKIAQRASGDVAANSRRSRRLLVEVYKRCRVEPGSAEAANYPICGACSGRVTCMRAPKACRGASRRVCALVPQLDPVPGVMTMLHACSWLPWEFMVAYVTRVHSRGLTEISVVGPQATW